MQIHPTSPEVQLPTHDIVYQPGFIQRQRRQIGLVLTSLLITTGCVTDDLQETDNAPSTTSRASDASELEDLEAAAPKERDGNYSEKFFANIQNHAPRSVCVVEIGDEHTRQFDDLLYGEGNRMDEVIAESPFSHWWSPATASPDGTFEDYTTDQASIDVALDADIADRAPGTNLECTINDETGEVTYQQSRTEIYPKGIPSPETVAKIVGNTFAVTSSSFANGLDVFTRSTGVHIGGGRVLAPWWSDIVQVQLRNGFRDTAAQNILLERFDRPDKQLIDTPVDGERGKDIYDTGLTDMPEIQFGSYNTVEPGDTLILSGYNRQVNSERGERFLYRVVVVDRLEDGRLVAAGGVEDSGSYRPDAYTPAGYDGYGSYGAGVFDMEGNLLGTVGDAHEYDYGWDWTYYGPSKEQEVDPAKEPEVNKYIDELHARLGLTSPRQRELERRMAQEAKDAEALASDDYAERIERTTPGFENIVYLNALPTEVLQSN